jgi:hypothetical protein
MCASKNVTAISTVRVAKKSRDLGTIRSTRKVEISKVLNTVDVVVDVHSIHRSYSYPRPRIGENMANEW